MSVDRSSWQPSWREGEYPSLPCPTCGAVLNFDEGSLVRNTSTHNSGLVDSAGIDEAISRFSAWFVCGNAKCGEYVVVAGDCRYQNAYGENGETITEFTLHPRSIFPGPPVIAVTSEVTTEICDALSASYQLLWVDYDACAARLRIVLELVLSEWGFPAETAEGKFINLHQRILSWKDLYGATTVANSLMAIKWLGNVSAHEGVLTLARLMDAYEILESLLETLFPLDPRRVEGLADDINRTKGR